MTSSVIWTFNSFYYGHTRRKKKAQKFIIICRKLSNFYFNSFRGFAGVSPASCVIYGYVYLKGFLLLYPIKNSVLTPANHSAN